MGSRFSRRVVVSISAGVLIASSLAACGSSAKIVGADGEEPPPESAATVEVTPEADSKDAPVSTELGVKVENGEISEVVLQAKGGDAVEGEFREDGVTWVPGEPLEYETTYTATVTAVDAEDIPVTTETSFTTMADPPNRMNASLWNGSEYEYGKAMPIMIDFPRDFSVPEEERANVEKRLFVTAEPAQPGAWHWFSGNHLEYRPKDYWAPGSVIQVRAGLGGLPLGGDVYGEKDITGTVHIDSADKEVHVSNDTKEMTAIEDGETVKTMKVSLGKASSPSYAGTFTIMEKLEETVFDTTAACGGKVEGDDCYRTDIQWAQRLTWSGQFIHSAPWSVGDQGVRNVSHGCVNASPEDSEWIFNFTRVGTPVTVEGTEDTLRYGDGFTAFGLSWEDFLEGSYLDHPEFSEAEDD